MFCKLSLDDFVTGKEAQFDIYLRLAENKIVKLIHVGEALPPERIESFRGKGVKFLYMLKEDFARYLGFNAEIASKIRSASFISQEKRINFVRYTGEIILEQFFLNEFDEDVFEAAQRTVENVVALLLEMPDTESLLESLNEHSDLEYAHSVGVSAYASLIARKMGWDSPRTMAKVALAGLLHDIGKKELAKNLLQKKRSEMSLEEVKAFESHPQRGAALLSQLRSLPGDIPQIVLHHHESWLGTGWPIGLRKFHINPLARVVSVADEFCHLVMRSPEAESVPVSEALERLCVLRRQEFDPAVLHALLAAMKPVHVQQIRARLPLEMGNPSGGSLGR